MISIIHNLKQTILLGVQTIIENLCILAYVIIITIFDNTITFLLLILDTGLYV